MLNSPSIALFIPTYNVQNEIVPVLEAIPDTVMARIDKVFIIDNGSSDNTLTNIKEFLVAECNPKIEFYQNKTNQMLGGSTVNAFEKTFKNNIDFLICLHGDGQADPIDLIQFIEKIDNNSNLDFILGSRFLKDSKIAEYSVLRLIFNKLFCYLQWLVIQQRVYDLGAFIAFNMKTINEVSYEALPRDMGYHPYLILVACKKLKRKVLFSEFPIFWGDVKSTNINIFLYGLTHLKRVLLLMLGVVLYDKNASSKFKGDLKLH